MPPPVTRTLGLLILSPIPSYSNVSLKANVGVVFAAIPQQGQYYVSKSNHFFIAGSIAEKGLVLVVHHGMV